jgi:hypothetical protein
VGLQQPCRGQTVPLRPQTNKREVNDFACGTFFLLGTPAAQPGAGVFRRARCSSRENQVGHSVFFLYIWIFVYLPLKIATPGLRRAYKLGTKAPQYKARASFLLFLFLFLFLSFFSSSSPSLTSSAYSALLAFPNICFGPHS